MTMNLIRQILAAPRRLYLAISATCLGMLALGVLYLQGMVGLQPCPMCIVQREALIAVAVFSALAAACKPGGWQRGFGVLAASGQAAIRQEPARTHQKQEQI